MLLLRRGRSAPQSASSLDYDVTLDLEPMLHRRRQECFAPWRPPLEAFETENGLEVRAEIGGLMGSEAEVLLDDDRLVIRGERSVNRQHDQRVYHESRVRYGPFEAIVRLPFPVDARLATASYRDGFLMVTLPRLAPVRVPTKDALAQRGGQ